MRIARLLVLGLLLRCPNCGARGVTRRWLGLKPECPGCGLRLDRGEDDHWLGAYLFNLIWVLLLVGVGLLAAVALTWPDPPWDAILWVGIPIVALFPIATYPFSKLAWLGFDLVFRPVRPGDFGEPISDPEAERFPEHRC